MSTGDGGSHRFAIKSKRVVIDEAGVLMGDIETPNGVIHIVDAMLKAKSAP
jgi:uncharacterized surface protein with fasciclin (FAS1) repeats